MTKLVVWWQLYDSLIFSSEKRHIIFFVNYFPLGWHPWWEKKALRMGTLRTQSGKQPFQGIGWRKEDFTSLRIAGERETATKPVQLNLGRAPAAAFETTQLSWRCGHQRSHERELRVCWIGGVPSMVPVSLGCCEHNKAGTELEENEGSSGPLSLSATTCSPMMVLHFPIPWMVLSLYSHSLEHTEQDALGNMSPTSDGNRGPFWH